jgi:hypothetical protein
MGGTSAAPAQTGQADLTTLLAASSGAPATATTLKPGRAFGRLRRAGGIYGTITYRGKDGADHTLAFERGTIVSVSNSQVVVRAPDGTTMTWLIVASTVVREQRAKATAAALHAGEQVFAGGPVVSGARDARLIAIRTTTGETS